MSKSNRDRVMQVGRCLAVRFPTPYPVTLRCPKKIAAHRNEEAIIRLTGYFGETWQEGRKIVIRIAVRKGIARYEANSTLLHEWAHAVTLRQSKIEDKRLSHGGHDDEWALAYGKIYRWFYDEGGADAAKNY